MYWNTSVTTVAIAGAMIAAMTMRRSVGRAGTSLGLVEQQDVQEQEAGGQQPVVQAAAEQHGRHR